MKLYFAGVFSFAPSKMTQLFRGRDGIYLYISTSTFEGVSLKPYRMVN